MASTKKATYRLIGVRVTEEQAATATLRREALKRAAEVGAGQLDISAVAREAIALRMNGRK